METLNELLPIIIYILLIVLIVLLIIIAVKVSKTMDKVNAMVDDVDGKLKALDPLFLLVETVTGKATLISDRFLSFVLGIVNKATDKKKKGKKEEE